MPSTMLDSVVYGGLWTSRTLVPLFDEAPRTRAWLEILAVLAEVQGEFGVIPAPAAAAVAATCRTLLVDDDLLDEVRRGREESGHSTAGLLKAIQARCPAGAAEWVYFGATVQDVTDTWTMGALRAARHEIARLVAQCDDTLTALAAVHRDTPMLGRTHGQPGLPVTFGFKVASWVAELRRHRVRLTELASRMDIGQLAGGVGSLSALGPRALALQARFCARLGLRPPDSSWTSSRDVYAEWGQLLTLLTGTADRIGHEVYNLQRAEIGELAEAVPATVVGSITMPHKRNPELGEHLGTLARVVRHQAAALTEGLVHDHERDGRAWKVEWHVLSEITLMAGRAIELLVELCATVAVRADRMRENLEATRGFVLSEAVLLAIAPRVGRATAHAWLHAAGQQARANDRSLAEAIRAHDGLRAAISEEELVTLMDYGQHVGASRELVDRIVVSRDVSAAFAAARALPRYHLGHWPTPLAPAVELGRAIGVPHLWLKHDELCGFGFGGNKVRGLELMLADAIAHGADVLVTGAGAQSNHVRATAAAAKSAGLDCVAVYWGSAPQHVQGNHALTQLLGASVRFTDDPDRTSIDRGLAEVADELRAAGRTPYVIPRGGACALGVIGHALAVAEFAEQWRGCQAALPRPRLMLAAGSGGTLAGWLLGRRLLSLTAPDGYARDALAFDIDAVTVSRPASDLRERVRALAAEAAVVLGADAARALDVQPITEAEYQLHDGWIGEGYGIPTAAGNDAIRRAAQEAGVFFDPTYTGKAFAALMHAASRGLLDAQQPLVFLHTGGEPSLFTTPFARSFATPAHSTGTPPHSPPPHSPPHVPHASSGAVP